MKWKLLKEHERIPFLVHSLICKHTAGRITRHQAINDVIAKAFVTADISVTKGPTGLSNKDNKRPDGLTPLTWDVTVICPLAQSYVTKYSTPGAAAELAASRKSDKYANLPNFYLFQPFALENLGSINESTMHLSYFRTWAQNQRKIEWSTRINFSVS